MGWGEMKDKDKGGRPHMGNTEGKSVAKVLGIDKPDEWLEKQWKVCESYLADSSEVYSDLTNQYLYDSGNIPFMVLVKLNSQEDTVASLSKLFYTIGYMRGKISQERIGGLEKLWGEGK